MQNLPLLIEYARLKPVFPSRSILIDTSASHLLLMIRISIYRLIKALKPRQTKYHVTTDMFLITRGKRRTIKQKKRLRFSKVGKKMEWLELVVDKVELKPSNWEQMFENDGWVGDVPYGKWMIKLTFAYLNSHTSSPLFICRNSYTHTNTHKFNVTVTAKINWLGNTSSKPERGCLRSLCDNALEKTWIHLGFFFHPAPAMIK